MSSASSPLVSAIVPVFNGEEFLAQALENTLNQAMDSLEVIVVNDGSTDASAEIARRYAANHPRRFVYLEQENAGLPGARNAAIRVARGRYLALLDSDDAWLPEHLATLVPVLESDSSLALAHANISFVARDGAAVKTREDRWSPVSQRDPFRAIFLRHDHVSCPTVVCRRELVTQLGGFDTAFSYLGCEDRDLWLTISARYPIRYIPKVTAHYRMHPGGMSRNLGRMRRARRLLVEKHSRGMPGKALRRQALAAVDVSDGLTLLEAGGGFRAAGYFCLALLRIPLSGHAWRGLRASLLRPILRSGR